MSKIQRYKFVWICEFVNFAQRLSKKMHFFEKFLRKNLEKVKCSSYLCIRFEKTECPISSGRISRATRRQHRGNPTNRTFLNHLFTHHLTPLIWLRGLPLKKDRDVNQGTKCMFADRRARAWRSAITRALPAVARVIASSKWQKLK